MKNFFNLFKKLKSKIRNYFFLASYRKDLPKSTKKFLKIMSYLKRTEFFKRKKYFTELNQKNELQNKLENNGYSIFDYDIFLRDKKFRDTMDYFNKKYQDVEWHSLKKSAKKNFLLSIDLDFNEKVKNFADPFVNIATSYLGTLPILDSCQFWYSPNENNVLTGSQMFHRDPEDYKQLKIFIPIEEIDETNGPLNVLDAKNSDFVFDKLCLEGKITRRNQKIEDCMVNQLRDFKINKILLKKNQCAFVDTCRCYHFGSRKSFKSRKLIFLHFTTAFSGKTPIFRRYDTEKKFQTERDKLIYGLQKKTINHYKNKEYLIL